jgi:hypothetical protein
MAHHGDDVCGRVVLGDGLIQYLVLHTKPLEQEFFGPTQTKIEVKLLTAYRRTSGASQTG